MGCYDGLAAVIPVLGAFIIWLPAAVFLALEDYWTQAISLVLWDMLVAATINNLLRLVLVGNRLHQHTLLIFMSLVGDLILFGSSELILGSMVLAITLILKSALTCKKTNKI